MSVSKKIFLSVVLFLGCFFTFNFWYSHSEGIANFKDTESYLMTQDMQYFKRIVLRESQLVDAFCSDYADWNESVDYVFSQDDAFIESNFSGSFYQVENLIYHAILNSSREVLYCREYESGILKYTDIKEFPNDSWPADSKLLPVEGQVSVGGLVMTSEGPLWFSSRNIRNNDGQGIPAGYMIMARPVSAELINELTDGGGRLCDFKFGIIPDSMIMDDQIEDSIEWHESGDLTITTVIKDIYGQEKFILTAKSKENLIKNFESDFYDHFKIILFVAVMGFAVFVMIFIKFITEPIEKTVSHIKSASMHGNPSKLSAKSKSKEPCQLTESYNQLVSQIYNNKEYVNAIISKASVGLVLIDRNFKILSLNNERIFDEMISDPSNAVGRKCYKVFGSHVDPCEDCVLTKAFKSKKSESSIKTLPSGKVLDITASPVFDEYDEIIGYVKVFEDREVKTARLALGNIEDKYWQLVDNLPLIVFRMDKAGRYQYINNAIEDVMGIKAGDIIGKTSEDAGFAGDVINIVQEEMLPTFRGGVARHCERKVVDQGRELWFDITYIPEKDSSGVVQTVLGIAMDISLQKKSEQQVEASERVLQQITDNVSDVFYLKSSKGLLYISPSIEKLTGIPIEKYYQDFYVDFKLIHPEDKKWMRQKVQQSLENPGYFDEEYRLVTESGEIKWVQHRTFVVPSVPGEESRIAGVIQDITAIMKANQKAQDQKSERRALVDNMLDAFLVFEPVFDSSGKFIDRRFVYVNAAFEEVTGLKWDEVKGRTYGEMWPDTSDSWIEFHARVLETGKPEVFEYYHQSTNRYYKSSVYRPWEHKDRYCTILSDITSRKLEEKEKDGLLRKLNRLNVMIENSQDIVAIISKEGQVQYVNQAASEFIGVSLQDCLTKSMKDFHMPDILDLTDNKHFSEAIDKGGWTGEVKVNKAKDSELILSQSIVPIFDDKGQIESFGAIMRDITEIKESEKILFHAKEETEHINLKLQNAVKKSKQLAHEAHMASRVKSEFLANMSHEIRTPLNAIIGFAQILEQEELEEIHKSYVDYIHSSGDHLLSLINDILDFSKVEAGKIEIDIQSCSVRELTSSLETVMRQKAMEKNIDFAVILDNKVPEQIKTDPTRLRQCLYNLVTNAIKFTHEGQVNITVDIESVNCIRLCVQDTGIGIPEDKLSEIFDPFKQADASTTREYGGTGLGLAITKKLVSLLNGEIKIESEVGHGSRFTILLPFEEVEQIEEPESAESQNFEIGSTENSFAGSGKILIAEDSPLNQKLLDTILSKAGYEFDIVADGLEAVKQVQKHDYSMVLMDIQMPNMNGYDATQEIRQQGYDLPIIAVTANAMNGDREKCISVGCSDYLAKPIKRDALIAIIEKYYQGSNVLQ